MRGTTDPQTTMLSTVTPDGLIPPDPEPYQVDPLSERVHSRGGTRVPPHVRALPTGRTTTDRREWRWGKPADAPSNSGAPQIWSPTDLEPGQARDASSHASIADVVRRLRP
jgi:hypothetical protein